MNLDWRRLRREALAIRRLVTLGALVTAIGGTLTAALVLGWEWAPSLLFGTLVIVTGPTVVTPLLRRIRVSPKVGTVLEAEGVLGDAIGAITAVVVLEVVVHPPSVESFALGPLGVGARLLTGVVVGLVGGLVIAQALRLKRAIPEGLENTFALSLALALFHLSDAVLHESGIAAVTVAGIVVGNVRSHALRDLREFKEQLTVLLIGMLFVLLAAGIRLEDLEALGRRGWIAVGVLMFVVRPVNVVLSTHGSDLNWREKAFLCWLAPRGIVAAAVSSLFAHSLDVAGVPGGAALQALVFLVIAVTVTVQGLSGGLVARVLGVARPRVAGYAILGANGIARELAAGLRAGGSDVVLLDTDPDDCRIAEDAGLRVLHGSALSDRTLQLARLDERQGVLAVTANDEINLLFGTAARRDYSVSQVWIALRRFQLSVSRERVAESGARLLFGAPRRFKLWEARFERGTAAAERWRLERLEERHATGAAALFDDEHDALALPLLHHRRHATTPFDAAVRFKNGDELTLLVDQGRRESASGWFTQNGWVRADTPPTPEGSIDA